MRLPIGMRAIRRPIRPVIVTSHPSILRAVLIAVVQALAVLAIACGIGSWSGYSITKDEEVGATLVEAYISGVGIGATTCPERKRTTMKQLLDDMRGLQ